MAKSVYEGVHVAYRGEVERWQGLKAWVKVSARNPLRCSAKFDGDGVWYPNLPTADFNIRPSQLAEVWDVQGR